MLFNIIFFKFRLTNDYAKDITTKWTRYPDSFVETIINETLKLLNLASDYKFGSFMTSLHFLSVIDIKAIWFTKWMVVIRYYLKK